MSTDRTRSTFWSDHWWKPLIALFALLLLGAVILGMAGYKADLADEREACQQQGGQIYADLCIASPVREVTP